MLLDTVHACSKTVQVIKCSNNFNLLQYTYSIRMPLALIDGNQQQGRILHSLAVTSHILLCNNILLQLHLLTFPAVSTQGSTDSQTRLLEQIS